jgi:GGDEF domain-containing protein
VSVDIDNQSSVAMKYGNRIARNLSQQVGLRIRGNVDSSGNYKLFHVSADRYYLLLEGVGLEEARNLARRLQEVLRVGEYRILPLSASSNKVLLPGNMLELTGVTVHMGVSTYSIEKLEELLNRYPPHTARLYVRTLLLTSTNMKLERGKLEGGNRIVSWDATLWGYKIL